MSFRARAETWFDSKSSGALSVDGPTVYCQSLTCDRVISLDGLQLLESKEFFWR